MNIEFIKPLWPLANIINVVTTTRHGGVSLPPFDQLNLATHVGDDFEHVKRNRGLLASALNLPAEPKWLQQVHGHHVINAGSIKKDVREADGSYTVDRDVVCAVMTADCLPVVISDSRGHCIGVAHAGWKGLLDRVLQNTIEQMSVLAKPDYAWLGPAIGSAAFEVGADVYQAFLKQNKQFQLAFEIKNYSKWNFDIYQAASIILKSAGITHIYGGQYCTYSDKDRFYSYRREGVTGRMATLAWKS